jgi:hypothetical protein
MSQKYRWRGILIVVLSVALSTPARAQSGGKIGPSNGTIVSAIVGVVAALVVVTVVAIHYSRKRAITGCVNSSGSGMTVTDETSKFTRCLATPRALSRVIE